MAGLHASLSASPRDSYHLYRDAFFELLPAPGQARLEIGCGEGRVARNLAPRGHRVTGIDTAPTLIRAGRSADPEGEYLVADAPELPFPDRSFDLVVAYSSLMDIAAMPTALSEAAAPPGWIHVTTAHAAIALIDRGDVIELSLDHDLGDDDVADTKAYTSWTT